MSFEITDKGILKRNVYGLPYIIFSVGANVSMTLVDGTTDTGMIESIDKIKERVFINGYFYQLEEIKDIKDIVYYADFENADEKDMVNHPQHYISENGLEAIDVIESFTSDLSGYEAVETGNVLKYMLRWKHKNGLEDLKKAQWYLNRLIENKEKEND